jgi:hypothetical protein
MKRSFSELISSIEFLPKPPFFHLMNFRYVALSARLQLTVFYGMSGNPKRFFVVKVRGLKGRLGRSDTTSGIVFPMPGAEFRAFLTEDTRPSRQSLGGRTWAWSPDGMTLWSIGELEFHFTRAEAKALSAAIFDNVLFEP